MRGETGFVARMRLKFGVQSFGNFSSSDLETSMMPLYECPMRTKIVLNIQRILRAILPVRMFTRDYLILLKSVDPYFTASGIFFSGILGLILHVGLF